MKDLGDMVKELVRIQNPEPFIWLYDMELDVTTVATVRTYLTSFNQPIQWNGKTWNPFPIKHGPISQGSKGDLPILSLQFSNVRREFAQS